MKPKLFYHLVAAWGSMRTLHTGFSWLRQINYILKSGVCPGPPAYLRMRNTVGIWYWFLLSRTTSDISVKWKRWVTVPIACENIYSQSLMEGDVADMLIYATQFPPRPVTLWEEQLYETGHPQWKRTQREKFKPQNIMNGMIRWLHWKLSYSLACHFNSHIHTNLTDLIMEEEAGEKQYKNHIIAPVANIWSRLLFW